MSIILFFAACLYAASSPIVDGKIDLTGIDFQSTTFDLQGEMHFYHQVFIQADLSDTHQHCSTLINTKNSWSNQSEEYTNYQSLSYGTYLFTIAIPPSLVGERLIIRPQHFISYASEIFVNGIRCANNGTVGTSLEDESYHPSRASEAWTFTPDTTKLNVVIWVANFHHFRGGIFKPIKIGREALMRTERERNITFDLIIIVCLLIMFLYHLVLFSVNTKEKTSLYFALACLVFSLDLSMQGPMCFFLFFPWVSFDVYAVMQLVTPYFIPASFFLFVYSLFPQSVSRRITITTVIVACSFFIYTLVVNVEARSFIIKPNYIYAVLLVFYLYYISYKLLKTKVYGSRLFFMAYLVFSLCALNDILGMFEIIHTHNMLTYGIVVFVFLLSILYGRKTTLLYEESERLSQNLKKLNAQLEIKVDVRTLELNKSLASLNSLNTFQEAMTHLIAHDLKNPLMQIIHIDLLREKDYPALKDSGHKMLNMIQNMLDVYRFNNDKIDLQKSDFDVSTTIDEVIEEFSFMASKKNLKIEIIQHEVFSLNADLQIFKRIISNTLSNAVRFSPDEGLIQIKVESCNEDCIQLSISNQGPGLSKEEQETIFAPKDISDLLGSEAKHTSGLGLSLCQMAIDVHQGKIGVQSDGEKGVCFWFRLPNATIIEDKSLKRLKKDEALAEISLKDKEYLRPYALELQSIELYETSKIDSIISAIDTSNPSIENWCLSLQQASYTLDENLYHNILKRVLD